MELSARNRIEGTVKSVLIGVVTAEVGDRVEAIFKATEVMIGK